MTPDDALAWLRVIFSAAFGCAGVFMMIYLTLHAARLQTGTIAELIGAALACGTAIVAIRWPVVFPSTHQPPDEGKKP